jgi:hypothetical protein
MIRLTYLLFTMLVAACAAAAFAAPNSYDGFAGYSVGDLTGKNGGTGWGGAYSDIGNSTVVDTTGLAYSGLQATGGSIRTADGGTATTVSFRNLDRIYGDDETETWVSLLGRRNGTTATNLFAGLSFYNSSGSAATNSEMAISTSVTGSLAWRVADLNNNGATASGTALAAGLTPDTVYLLTALIRWGVTEPTFPAALGSGTPSAVYFYVNPAFGTTPTLASANAGLNINITNFDKIRFAGQNGMDYSFDEFRIGNTFADVTPTVSNNTDFNVDGFTDINDFNILRNNYLTGTLFSQGDSNHDGIVNYLDFFLWRTAFVGGGGSTAGLSFDFGVPEPSACVSFLFGSLVLMNCRRVRRRDQ